jgi:hypothetical protein
MNPGQEIAEHELHDLYSSLRYIQEVYFMKADPHSHTKQCCKCKTIYPATPEYFAHDKNTNDGFCAACKGCANMRLRKYRAENPEKSRESSRRSRNKDIEKSRAREKDYRNRNTDKRREYDREYHAKNRVRIITRKRRYYADNKENIRQSQREWYRVNAERMQERSRVDRLNNPERVRETGHNYLLAHRDLWQVYSQRRAARKRALPNTLSIEEWKRALIWWENCCAYCGNNPPRLTMDHFVALSDPLCPGTTVYNILPACRRCNARKSKHEVSKWISRQFGETEALKIQNRIDLYFRWVNKQQIE